MDLKAGVGRFEHHVIVAQQHLVGATDVDLVVLAAQLREGVIQESIARVWGLVMEAQVGFFDRGEDARHHEVCVVFLSGVLALFPEGAELLFDGGECVSTEDDRIDAELEVIEPEFVFIEGFIEGVKDLCGEGRRAQGGVEDKEFLFCANASDAALNAVGLEEFFECTHIL